MNRTIAVLYTASTVLGALIIFGSDAQAGVIDLTTSSDQNYVHYYKLEDYPHPNGPNSALNGNVNWPQRSEGCTPTGTTRYKTLPWLAAHPFTTPVISGNVLTQSGDCGSRHFDGGTNSLAPWCAARGASRCPGGAVIRPGYQGWAQQGTRSAFMNNQAFNTSGTNVDSSVLPPFLSSINKIWGDNKRDDADKYRIMFNRNNWYNPPTATRGALYSNGSTLFRNEFIVSQDDIDTINASGNNLKLAISADDWFVVYINGQFVAQSINTAGYQDIDISNFSNLLDAGVTNVLGIQVIDKALWEDEGIVVGRAAGLAYRFYIETSDVPPPNIIPTPTTTTRDFEKGLSNQTITHSVRIPVAQCPAAPITFNVVISGRQGDGSSYTTPYNNVVFRTGQCSLNIPDKTINANYLNGLSPGTIIEYNTQVFSTAGLLLREDKSEILVYEAPFARFFGNDVAICGTGDENRFVFNTNNNSQGSYAEFASIYKSGNDARVPNNNDFSGLNSSRANSGFPAALDTNWNNDAMCKNEPQPSDFAGVAGVINRNGPLTIGAGGESVPPNGQVTYNVDGNVTITSNITRPSVTPFNPDTYPVVLIYAKGDINISNNVDYIEAVLVAKGSVNTCSESGGDNKLLDDNCTTPLKIYGSVIAEEVNLQRARGTRQLAATTNINITSASNSTAAEIIEYPWYLNFVRFNLKDQKKEMKYDAYFSLPPRL